MESLSELGWDEPFAEAIFGRSAENVLEPYSVVQLIFVFAGVIWVPAVVNYPLCESIFEPSHVL